MRTTQRKRRVAVTARRLTPLSQLRLEVIDHALKTVAAFVTLKNIGEAYLKGNDHLTVIDLVKQPQWAKADQIIALPTVVRKHPTPMRTMISTLPDTARILVGLNLRPAA